MMKTVYTSMICAARKAALVDGALFKYISTLLEHDLKAFYFDVTDVALEPGQCNGDGVSPFTLGEVRNVRDLLRGHKGVDLGVHLLVKRSPQALRRYKRAGCNDITLPVNDFIGEPWRLVKTLRDARRESKVPDTLRMPRRSCVDGEYTEYRLVEESPPPDDGSPKVNYGISLPMSLPVKSLDHMVLGLSDHVLLRCMHDLIDRPLTGGELDAALLRVRDVRYRIEFAGRNGDPLKTEVWVMGGVTPQNVKLFYDAGASRAVMGTALFEEMFGQDYFERGGLGR